MTVDISDIRCRIQINHVYNNLRESELEELKGYIVTSQKIGLRVDITKLVWQYVRKTKLTDFNWEFKFYDEPTLRMNLDVVGVSYQLTVALETNPKKIVVKNLKTGSINYVDLSYGYEERVLDVIEQDSELVG